MDEHRGGLRSDMKVKGFIFDLDGTIYLGDDVIEGAPEAIQRLKERGDKVAFLTNKSIARRTDYVEKLSKLGIEVTLNEVINSNYITALYLKNILKSGEKVYVIGEQPLFDELLEQGITVTTNPKEASYVILGWDRQFTYDKINDAFQAWKLGAKIIATNPDRTCPIDGGEIPDCAAMIGALKYVINEPIEEIIGKPSELMASYVLKEILELPAESCYMVGDRLETDIKMANDVGMSSVLVMTGITSEEMLEDTQHQPRYVLPSVAAIDSL